MDYDDYYTRLDDIKTDAGYKQKQKQKGKFKMTYTEMILFVIALQIGVIIGLLCRVIEVIG